MSFYVVMKQFLGTWRMAEASSVLSKNINVAAFGQYYDHRRDHCQVQEKMQSYRKKTTICLTSLLLKLG